MEPLVASLAVAFSTGGVLLALMMVAVFLARRPLQVLVTVWWRGTRKDVVPMASTFVGIFGAIFFAALAGAALIADPYVFVPLIAALPLAAYQAYADVFLKGRQLLGEIFGALVMAAAGASILLAGGALAAFAAAAAFMFSARFISSILYVRSRLALEKGKGAPVIMPIAAHGASLAGVAALAFAGLLPWLVTVAFVILMARGSIGLSRYRRPAKAMKIGVLEVAYGTLVAASFVAGYFLFL